MPVPHSSQGITGNRTVFHKTKVVTFFSVVALLISAFFGQGMHQTLFTPADKGQEEDFWNVAIIVSPDTVTPLLCNNILHCGQCSGGADVGFVHFRATL